MTAIVRILVFYTHFFKNGVALILMLLGSLSCLSLHAAQNSVPNESTAANSVKSKANDSASKKSTSIKKKTKVIEETVLGMNVTGNKELPNMLYIVPWKAKTPPLTSPSVQPLLKEVFSTLDPEVFSRESKFYFKLTEKQEKPLTEEQK